MTLARRILAVSLVITSFWPAVVAAQASKAGVVTTLEGNVTAARAATAQPVALKFKDDVFVNDRVVTGDGSTARMLLGGKAVVTVRERSALTITEVPGKSTIALESGKIAVAVARERMTPGDQIEVRTPNAVAGVRGTVFVVEVLQASAALDADATYTTWLYGFTGQVLVNVLNQVYTVGPNTVWSRIGSQLPTLGPLTLELRQRAETGLHLKTPIVGGAGQHAANESALKDTLATLNSGLGAVGSEAPPTLPSSNQTITPPILPGGLSTIPTPAPTPPAPPRRVDGPPSFLR